MKKIFTNAMRIIFMLRHSCCLEKFFTIPVKMKIISKKAMRNIFILRLYRCSIIRIDFCFIKIIFNNDAGMKKFFMKYSIKYMRINFVLRHSS